MLHKGVLILFCCCLGFPFYVTAAEVFLSWEFPRAYEPHPDRFVLTYTGSGGTPGALIEHAVPWHPASACASLRGHGPDVFCTRLACPGAGIWAFWLAAEWGDQVSGKTNLVTCQIQAHDPTCRCTAIDDVVKDLTNAVQAALPASPPPLLASVPPLPSLPTPGAALETILGHIPPT